MPVHGHGPRCRRMPAASASPPQSRSRSSSGNRRDVRGAPRAGSAPPVAPTAPPQARCLHLPAVRPLHKSRLYAMTDIAIHHSLKPQNTVRQRTSTPPDHLRRRRRHGQGQIVGHAPNLLSYLDIVTRLRRRTTYQRRSHQNRSIAGIYSTATGSASADDDKIDHVDHRR